MTTQTLSQVHAAASKAVTDGETKGLSERTMAKKYKALFAAEDAVKAMGGWSAWIL